MKKSALAKEQELSWYRGQLKKLWETATFPKPIPYLYDHPFWPLVCQSFLASQKNNNTDDWIYRAMVNKRILDFVSAQYEAVEKELVSLHHEIHLNQLCRNIRSGEEVAEMWEKVATFLRWHSYSDAQLNTLYYDQRLFAEQDAPKTLRVFAEFMEHWRGLLNDKVEQIMNSLFNVFIHEGDGEYEYGQKKERGNSVLPPKDSEEDEDTIAGRGNALKLTKEETYGNQFKGLINQQLYDKHKDFVHEIVETLGRVSSTKQEHMEMEALLQYSFPAPPYEDIEGVSAGNRIMDILPSEHAIMSDPESEILFYQKFASRQLQQFSCFPKEYGAKPQLADESDMGPIIISIDTSGSMEGYPVDFARLLVVDAFKIAKQENRPLYIIQFSVGAQCLDLSGENGEEELITFLSNNKSGGSDGAEMLWAILQQLKGEPYSKADALIVSDFEFAYCSGLEKDIHDAQQKGARFYALNVRPGSAHPNYAKLLDNIWEIKLGGY